MRKNSCWGRHPILSAKRPVRYCAHTPYVRVSTLSGKNMSDRQTKFDAALANSKNLTERPDNATLLKLYALYKQASAGDNTDKKPGFSDMVGRAKWEAWSGLKGTGSEDAMQQYVDLIESLS